MRLSRLRTLLRDHFCLFAWGLLLLVFFLFLLFLFLEEEDRKGDDKLFFFNDALLSAGREAFMKLSLSDSLCDSASWCLPSSQTDC